MYAGHKNICAGHKTVPADVRHHAIHVRFASDGVRLVNFSDKNQMHHVLPVLKQVMNYEL
jgi:hypothetical protein